MLSYLFAFTSLCILVQILICKQVRPRHWQGNKKIFGNKMCYLCAGASVRSSKETVFYTGPSNTTYTNVFQGSRWWGTDESHEDFVASLSLPNLLALSPYFKNFMVRSDTLRVIYRGFLPEFCGSAIMELASECFWAEGATTQANLDVAYRTCVAFCKRHKLGMLSLDDFSKGAFDGDFGFPALPGKGVDSKLVALWLPSQTAVYLETAKSDHAKVLDVNPVCNS